MKSPTKNHNLFITEDAVISAEIKPYSKRELQQLYEVSDKSFTKWLQGISKQIGKRYGRYYNPLQVQTIFSNFGVPFMKK